MQKIISLIIVISYLIFVLISGGGEFFLRALLSLLLPIALIWFGDELSGLTGNRFMIAPVRITNKSPGFLVKFMGWVLLLLAPVIVVIFYLFA